MDLAQSFAASRPLARHCAALLRPAPGPDELLAALARAGDRLARALRQQLAPLTGGRQPVTRPSAPVTSGLAGVPGGNGDLAAHALVVAEPGAVPVLISIEGRAVLALTDRAFGGPGEASAPLPDEFPMAADLMASRIERLIMRALAAALDRSEETLRPLRRDAGLARLAPFASDAALTRIDVAVEEQGQTPWNIALTLPIDGLAAMLGVTDPAPGSARRAVAADPADAPFCDLPLPVRALMAEVDLPVSTVAALSVGQVLPVAVARIVPVEVAGRTIARGTVGAVDDRVAVQITRLA
jgi:flagellar motor switch protein FliM